MGDHCGMPWAVARVLLTLAQAADSVKKVANANLVTTRLRMKKASFVLRALLRLCWPFCG